MKVFCEGKKEEEKSKIWNIMNRSVIFFNSLGRGVFFFSFKLVVKCHSLKLQGREVLLP